MDKFMNLIGGITDFIWGLPMMLLLLGGGLYLTFKLGFFQFRYMPHIISQTFGKILSKSDASEGTLTPFQAATSALASTVGAANIIGVPVAIAFGGPGAIFWMWVVSLIGMAAKYSEVVLGVKYREKNEEGEWVGGPMYYIEKGLGWKPVASFFAFALMLEIVASTMVQSNSLSTTISGAFHISPIITGLLVMVLIGIIVFGGISRIGKITEKFVPFMVGIYIIGSLIVVFANVSAIPSIFALIFEHAFTPIAAAGGFGGAGIAAAIRWGLARGTYSNEAGMGTAPIAHATAKTDHPAKQGFWGVFEVIVDTIIICTMTAIVVLCTGQWEKVPSEQASNMVTMAWGQVFGDQLAGIIMSIALFCFVLSTVVVIIYYGEKQAEYLFGTFFSKVMRFVYVGAIFVGAIGGLKFVWQFLDILLALVILPNIIALLFLGGEVKEITKDYFTRIYKKKNYMEEVQLSKPEQSLEKAE
ncbi:alanine/glycine:cation symporter family protein [Rummeliibacillus stabekisii]|uniref:alanine/glycine:cation symporter family protein n=1 Tax=Rummeliibacillus stabekisii TaxID=241244 RepID=UPI00116B6AF7|nr:sodium:alanine symporter family protein [Rummeliibacillus stabekisii]MBB5170386.1 AGCS family alanine or glycine:cation symporter [Rummeliibacillus stabekisii]GEL04644.1 sodium:alanine symporter [Rummeliibacillus stabekisii]